MKTFFLIVSIVFAVVLAVDDESDESTSIETTTMPTTTTTPDEVSLRCHCNDHCAKSKVIGLKKNNMVKVSVSKLFEEDSDQNGDRSICARNRDLVDHTFPSVCHMMCYNRCTDYHLRKNTIDDKTVLLISAYRENFYKLRDGPC